MRTLQPEARILIRGVGWSGYESLLAMVGEHNHVRLTYDRGDVELMTTSPDHERFKKLIGRFIEIVTEELGIPCEGAGSTTWRREDLDRGLEADECYDLAHSERLAGKAPDLLRHGPPDLAVEVDISPSKLDRPGICAALGVAEVWRHDGESIRFERLRADGTYEPAKASVNLPFLVPADVDRWLAMVEGLGGQTPWARQVRTWARDELARRRG